MRNIDGERYVCYTKKHYKKLMSYVFHLKDTEKQCKKERRNY